VSGFYATTRDGHSIGLNEDGELWFNSCCDADNVYLTTVQLRNLWVVVGTAIEMQEGSTGGAE